MDGRRFPLAGYRALGAAALAAVAMASPALAEELAVATYNIQHGEGTDGSLDLARQADALIATGADIVALQEVDYGTRRTGRENQAQRLAALMTEKTGARWRHLEAPAIALQGGSYGNGLLYDDDVLDLVAQKVVALPGSPDGDGARSAGLARFRMGDATQFTVAATHLTHKNAASADGGSLQIRTIRMLDGALAGDGPTIIAGDFNASIDRADDVNTDTMTALVDMGWRIDTPADGSSRPDGRSIVIDYVVSRNTEGWDVVSSRIVGDGAAAVASDHLPVVVTYETRQ